MPKKEKKWNPSIYGGAAIEYLMVSLFALVLSVASIAWMKGVLEEELGKMTSEYGLEDFSFFKD